MNSAVRIVNTTDATSDDLRAFVRDNLSKLPVNVQLEILGAVQDAGRGTLDEYTLRSRLTLTEAERHEVEQTFRAMEHYRQIFNDSGMAGPQGKHRVDFDYLASYLCSQAFALHGIITRLTDSGTP